MPGRGDEDLPAVILQPAIAPGFAGELDGGYIQERLEFAEGRRRLGFGEFRLDQQEGLVFIDQKEINLLLFFVFDEVQRKTSPAHIIPYGNRPVKLQRHHVFKSGSRIFDPGNIPQVDLALLLYGPGNFSSPGGNTKDQEKSFKSGKPAADCID